MAGGSTQPLTEISTRNHPGDRGRQGRNADKRRHLWAVCLANVAASTSESYEPPQPVIGIALFFFYWPNIGAYQEHRVMVVHVRMIIRRLKAWAINTQNWGLLYKRESRPAKSGLFCQNLPLPSQRGRDLNVPYKGKEISSRKENEERICLHALQTHKITHGTQSSSTTESPLACQCIFLETWGVTVFSKTSNEPCPASHILFISDLLSHYIPTY
jgi:hypothetical protein